LQHDSTDPFHNLLRDEFNARPAATQGEMVFFAKKPGGAAAASDVLVQTVTHDTGIGGLETSKIYTGSTTQPTLPNMANSSICGYSPERLPVRLHVSSRTR
jgi:hypothetical protein